LKKFNIQFTHSAVKDLNNIPEAQRVHIVASIKSLPLKPFAPGSNIKKLKGFKPALNRMRSGDYRVLYRIKEDTITVIRVIDRKDLETIIKRLREEPAPYS
jgi:mRNA-degrading endonuclease RelE of RelBE toxin-antitoxin system